MIKINKALHDETKTIRQKEDGGQHYIIKIKDMKKMKKYEI